MNPHGGQLSEGRTHGYGFVYEAMAQLRREAGERQVADARTAVVTSGGGTPSGVLLLQRDGSLGRAVNPYRTLRSVVRFKPIETDRVERRLARAASVADLRAIARRRLPRGVFDYVDGGAEDERTLAANTAAYGAVGWRPRVLNEVEQVDVGSTVARQAGRLPAGPGPGRLPPPRSTPTASSPAAEGGGPGGPALHAVDHEQPVDRGGPGGQRRPPVVPGLRLAGPGLVKEMVDRAARRPVTRPWC